MRHCALVSLDSEPEATMCDLARQWLDAQAERWPALAKMMPELQADAADYAATWAERQARRRCPFHSPSLSLAGWPSCGCHAAPQKLV